MHRFGATFSMFPDALMAENDKLVRVNSLPLDRPGYPGYPVKDLDPSGPDLYSFGAWWDILRKRWGTVLAVAVINVALVTIVVFRMKPVYRATARMEVQAETPPLQTLNELNSPTSTDGAFLQTQVDLLQNNNLAWETIQELGLANRMPELGGGLQGPAASSDRSILESQSSLIRGFKNHLHVELLGDSRLVEVSVDSVDPGLAAAVANALVRNYVESNFQSKYETTRQATAWMEQQLNELKAKVQKSQQALVDYERENSVADVGDKENVVRERLSQLSTDLTAAQVERANKQSVYDSMQNSKAEANGLANDLLLEQLDSKSAELHTEYAATTAQYGPNYYKVKELRNQINEVEALVAQERKRVVDRIGGDYRTALRREELLSQQVAIQKKEVEKLNQLLIQYTLLKGEFETNQQLYNELLKRLKDATVSVSLRATNVRLADEALIPTTPIRPNKRVDMAAALLVGLILGVALAFVQASLDRSVKTADDIEAGIGVPTLAVIPLGTKTNSRYGRYFLRESQKPAGNGNQALALLNAPGSEMAESFRVLRTSILLSGAPPPQVVLVTSAHPSEGKSFASVNLALALAQRGDRVALVDGDLRKPSVMKTLGMPEGKACGLSTVLTGGHDLEESLQVFAAAPNLWLLPPGPIPPNPADLVSSPAMESLLRQLRGRFQHIVLDSPPLLLVTDGILLSTLADGVVLVVESGGTSRGALHRVRRLLDRSGANILGAVLNKIDAGEDGYPSSGAGYYGYYYSRERSTSTAAEVDPANEPPPNITRS